MTTKIKHQPLTVDDIEAGYENEEWGGFGYLGERRLCGSRLRVEAGDEVLLAQANQRNWSRFKLFAFMNSRDGRHFGDLVFGGWSDEQIAAQAPAFFRVW